MEYRGFIIEQHFVYHDPFTKVPDGRFDGIWYKDGEEECRGIYRQTMSQVKHEIDNYIAENLVFRIQHSKSNQPAEFYSIIDAMNFCRLWKIAAHEVEIFLFGEKINFDSI